MATKNWDHGIETQKDIPYHPIICWEISMLEETEQNQTMDTACYSIDLTF